jgi:hypothetical protein
MTRVLAALFAAFLPSAVAAQQTSEAVSAFSVPVPGATVDVSVKTTFSSQDTGQGILIAGSSTLDLSDLQRKLPAIVARLDVPRNSCQRFAADNIVAAPQSAAVVLANNTATLNISGSSSVWTCLQNPLPEAKVIWSARQIAPGVTTQVPNVVTSAGSPIKSRLIDTQFEWTAPLVWTQPGKLQAANGTISLKNAGVDHDPKPEWLAWLSASLANQVNMVVEPLFDPNKILPSTMIDKHPAIESVEWIDQDGHLAAKVKWSATVPADKDGKK